MPTPRASLAKLAKVLPGGYSTIQLKSVSDTTCNALSHVSTVPLITNFRIVGVGKRGRRITPTWFHDRRGGSLKMMEVIVEVRRAFAQTISEKKTVTMRMSPPRTPRTMVRVEAARQTYTQVQSFTYPGSAVTETPDMFAEIVRQTLAYWMRIRRNQPKVAISLKTPTVKAEAIEALYSYGCSIWTLRQEHCLKFRTVYHRVMLRIIGAQRKRPDQRMTSYSGAPKITGCESIETTLSTTTLLWAGTLIRISGVRLQNRIVFGNLEGAVRRGRDGKG